MKEIIVDNHTDVIEVMRKEAKANGLLGGLIGLRQFPISRMSTVTETGTDRSRNAKVYEDDGDCKGMHASPDKVTYMRVVDTASEPPMAVPKFRRQVPMFDNLNFLNNLDDDRAHLLYDPRKIFRASENEFWFSGDPKKALIAVVTVRSRK